MYLSYVILLILWLISKHALDVPLLQPLTYKQQLVVQSQENRNLASTEASIQLNFGEYDALFNMLSETR